MSEREWCRYDAAARILTLTVHVQPNARASGIAGLHGDALKIRVAAPAIDNKANAALVRFVAEVLGVPARTITLRRGAQGRRKTLEIAGAAPDLAAKLQAAAAG